jgi:hypothetical protein
MSEPSRYGFEIAPEEAYKPVPYKEVKIDSAVTSFEQFSRHFDTNYKMLKFLNPWLRKPFLTNSNGKEYIIRVPARDARVSAGI